MSQTTLVSTNLIHNLTKASGQRYIQIVTFIICCSIVGQLLAELTRKSVETRAGI